MGFSDYENIKNSREFGLRINRTSMDGMLLMLKSMLILNAGALVSILVAVSRSVTEKFASATIGSAEHFLLGLISVVIAMMFFAPIA